MTYTELLAGIAHQGTAPQGEATLVAQDSRRVVPGAVYVAVEGRVSDGHDFAAAALEAGAGMLVTQRPLGLPREVTVQDSRAVHSLLCQNFFGRPGDAMTLVGITGTNGKSTVASVLKQVLEQLGHPCGLIGTISSQIRDMEIPAKFTTPEAWDLNALLARMRAAGCTHVVMEASSQALAQKRLYGMRFALGVFTNLSQDHLDYHGTMEEYFAAKGLLFAQSDALLAGRDDEWGRRLLAAAETPLKRSFSVKDDAADFVARNVELQAGGVRFAFLGNGFLQRVAFPMPGAYSAANALAAGAAAVMLGEEPGRVAGALGRSRGVPGRCEVLYNGKFTVVCDFAHTADAIDKLLAGLRPFARGRLVVLFGCAGERDAAKRPAMSEAALRYGDEIILTSDNPRREPVQAILDDALPPLAAGGKPYHVIADREAAVRFAMERVDEGGMLVLCGKGHEDYQVMDGVTLYLSEKALVAQELTRLGLA